jgi:hypothetical protein
MWLGLQVANNDFHMVSGSQAENVPQPTTDYRRVTGAHGIYHQP